MARVGLKVFITVAKEWDLKPIQKSKMLNVDIQTISKWIAAYKGGINLELDHERLARFSIILQISSSMKALYPAERILKYMSEKNKAFDGKTPLDLMTTGSFDDLNRVGVYLESAMQGHFS